MPRVHLTAIYRQAARSLIIQSARRINAGELPFLSLDEARETLGADAELDEDFFFIARQGPESMREAVVELVCERIPARYGLDPRTDVMTLVPMRRGAGRPRGAERGARAAAQSRRNAGRRRALRIRVGSRIVQTKNDYTPDREVMNGEVAFILDWDEEEGEARLSLDDGEREIVVPASALETYELAWALTVHRAQGSQFPAVVAPWSTAYARDALAAAPLHRGHARAAAVRARRRAQGASRWRVARASGGAGTRRSPSGSSTARTAPLRNEDDPAQLLGVDDEVDLHDPAARRS